MLAELYRQYELLEVMVEQGKIKELEPEVDTFGRIIKEKDSYMDNNQRKFYKFMYNQYERLTRVYSDAKQNGIKERDYVKDTKTN